MAEYDYVELNKDRKAQGASPIRGVKYVWTDDGRPDVRHPTTDYIKAQAVDFSEGKRRRWNPQKERYMDFVTSRGLTPYEQSDINMSPEGKMRRQLMDQHDNTSRMVRTENKAYPPHYWDQSLNTKIEDADPRQSSNLLVNLGMSRQSRY